MGNQSFQQVKEQAIKDRQTKLQNQMVIVKQSFSKFDMSSEKANKISSLNVFQAIEMLNEHQLTSQQLLAALIFRCITVGKQLNIYIATNFAYSIEVAITCDKVRKQSGKKNWTFNDGQYNSQKHLPGLFGIPLSVKDVFHVQSMPTTLGIFAKAKNYEPQSQIIKCVKNSGMIPFIKTNIPQFGMGFQTSNNLWGRTVSPWNKLRSVGGSSGGEGAIISAKCSLIGLGSDIGGSIRVPAQHCGVFGIKPYSKRISSKYHAVFSKSFVSFGKNIPLCIGPLAKSSRDLALFMSTVTTEQFYQGCEDPYVKIVPFNYQTYNKFQSGGKKHRIGYIKSLKDIQPSIASRRAMDETIQMLKKQGHQILQIKIPNQFQIIQQFVGQYGSCKYKNYRQILKGQKEVQQYRNLAKMSEMSWPIRYIVSTIAKKLMPRPYNYFLSRKPFQTVMEYQEHIGIIQQLKAQWIKYWRENKLDFVICPGFGCPAFPHGKSQLAGLVGVYTFIWNVLDMVTGSMPITVVRQEEQFYQSAFNDLITKQLKEVALNSLGLPIGIQVIGLPYKQEQVLGFMSYMQSKVQFYNKNPLPQI